MRREAEKGEEGGWRAGKKRGASVQGRTRCAAAARHRRPGRGVLGADARVCRHLLSGCLLPAVTTALLVALQPAPSGSLKKIGKGKYAHWPIATHTTAAQSITVALAIDRSPGDNRIKIKFLDASSPASGACAHLPEDVLRTRMQNGREAAVMGLLLLEKRSSGSNFLGMQISEQYRGRGLSTVFVAIWVSLCLIAGVPAHTGTIDKPVLAHVLTSLGFKAQGGVPASLTSAKRLRDCSFTVDVGQPCVRVNTVFKPPEEADLRERVAHVLSADGGRLHVQASAHQILAALNARWRLNGKVII